MIWIYLFLFFVRFNPLSIFFTVLIATALTNRKIKSLIDRKIVAQKTENEDLSVKY